MLGFAVRLIGLVLVVLTVGCASTAEKYEYQPDPSASEALNIARAAGMTRIEDMERQERSLNGGLGRDLSDGGFALSSAFNPPPGFSGGMGVGFGILSLFTGGGSGPPMEAFDGFIAWVPEDLVSNGEDPEVVIKDTFRRSFDEFLTPSAGLIEDVNIGMFNRTFTGWGDLNILRTEDCPVSIQDENRRIFDEMCSGIYGLSFVSSNPKRQIAPEFLRISGNIEGPYFFYILTRGIFEKGLYSDYPTHDAFMTAFSAHLPSWIYVYRTYDRETNEPPYLVHQGRRLDFVKPG